jgi:hypothetical protein
MLLVFEKNIKILFLEKHSEIMLEKGKRDSATPGGKNSRHIRIRPFWHTVLRRQIEDNSIKNRHIMIRIIAFMALRIRSKTGYLLRVT